MIPETLGQIIFHEQGNLKKSKHFQMLKRVFWDMMPRWIVIFFTNVLKELATSII